MTNIYITETEVKKAVDLAKARYNSNRKANNPKIEMYDSKVPYYGDVIGMLGEIAVAKYLGVDIENHDFVYEQSEFSKIKEDINDVLDYEVRSTHYSTGKLIIKDKDLKANANTPFILSRVEMDLECGDAKVTLVGWYYAKDAINPDWEKTVYTTAYYVPNDKLHPLDSLPKSSPEKVA